MTSDIYGTGQTNILAQRFASEKTYKPAHGRVTQVTEINTLDQITNSKDNFIISYFLVEIYIFLFKNNSLCPSTESAQKKVLLGL